MYKPPTNESVYSEDKGCLLAPIFCFISVMQIEHILQNCDTASFGERPFHVSTDTAA